MDIREGRLGTKVVAVLQLLAVEIKPGTGGFSMISEMMTNGNIVNYIRVEKANRVHLVRSFVPTAELKPLI